MLGHLADVSVRSVLVAGIAGLGVAVLRGRRTVAVEHAIWTAVVAGMLGLLAFGQFVPRVSIRVLESGPVTAVDPGVSGTVAMLTGRQAAQKGGSGHDLPPHREARAIDWGQAAAFGYSAIALGLLARFFAGMIFVRRLLAGSRAVRGIWESDAIAVPVTVGWWRPRVVLPVAWREWDEGKLDAVLEHEGAHVRRRDGLVAAVAGINRCLFWFHPLAWWLERRVALLAEQACDEACVAATGDRKRYAELLLEMAATVDGSRGRLQEHALTMASGSHLRQRVESILQDGRVLSKGLRWTGWAVVALCGIPVVVGTGALALERQAAQEQAGKKRVEFEVASIKPAVWRAPQPGDPSGRGGGPAGATCPETFHIDAGRVDIGCGILKRLISYAYGMPVTRITAPEWMDDRRGSRFDVQAKLPQGSAAGAVPDMVRTLLEDRFDLAVHRATVEQTVLALVVAKGGLKVKESDVPYVDADDGDNDVTLFAGLRSRRTRTPNAGGRGFITTESNALLGTLKQTDSAGAIRFDAPNITMEGLAHLAGGIGPLASEVVNMTGIEGRYGVTLEVSMEPMFAVARQRAPGEPPSADLEGELMAVVLKCVNDGLAKSGLTLEKRKGPVEMLVVDKVERMPKEN